MDPFCYKLHYAPDNASLVVRLALEELKQLVDNSRRVNGKLSQATIRKAEKLLDQA